eukprot:6212947-Pleurochrysis_carterae.AAC.1
MHTHASERHTHACVRRYAFVGTATQKSRVSPMPSVSGVKPMPRASGVKCRWRKQHMRPKSDARRLRTPNLQPPLRCPSSRKTRSPCAE